MNTFLDVMKTRRSQYMLNKDVRLTKQEIVELVQEANLHSPTAFNMQSARTIVLFHEQHEHLWDITLDILRGIVPADSFQPTKDKINSFKAAFATILYFDDTNVTDAYANDFPLYRDNFKTWAQQGNGILQFAIWNILSEHGLGATIQHYNPLIDKAVYEEWKIPASWKLIAQMPLGNPCGEPSEKTFEPLDKRVIVFE